MKLAKIVISILILINLDLQSAKLIFGNASAAAGSTTSSNIGVYSFNQPAVAKAYNPTTRELFLGLSNQQSGSTAATYTISKFNPYQNYNNTSLNPVLVTPAFQPICVNTNLQTATIDFLALANSLSNPAPLLASVPVISPGSLTANQIYIQTSAVTTGTYINNVSSALLGTNTLASTANGSQVGGIAQLAGGVTYKDENTYFFAAVLPSGGSFGSVNSGIAVVNAVLSSPYFPNPQTLQINQVAAEPGQTGIKAALFDPTVQPVNLTGLGTPAIVSNRVSLFWDDQLQRLYTGLQLATSAAGTGNAGAGAASVAVGQLDQMEQGELTINSFLTAQAIASLTQGGATNIVVATQTANTPLNLAAGAAKVMHTSTGASYLIVWGGNGTITVEPTQGGGTVGNLLWALPLVDLQDPTDPSQGLLADKTNFNDADHRFEIPATTAAGLTINTDPFAQIGGGPIPAQPSTPISGVGSGYSDPLFTSSGIPIRDTLDIVVAGDTVYVAMANPQTDLDDAGVFYSQAMFDQTGQIIRWTPWAKRAFPFDAFDTIPQNNGNVRYVTVDGVNGNVTAVDGTIGQTALITSWNLAQNASELPMLLNQALCTGCYSVLDLDQSLAVISEIGPSRYALFGGINKVAFAKTTVSRETSAPFNVTPQPNEVPAPQKLVTYLNKNGTPLSQGCLCPGLPKSCCNHEFSGNCSCCNKRPVPANTPLTYCPQNFLITNLPSGAGAVKVLEYSKQPAGILVDSNLNYFFAGTNAGLFVFAQNGIDGFDASDLDLTTSGDLDKRPFSTGSWVQATAIKGSVIDIQTSGLTLYVTTVQLPYNAPILYSVFRINFEPTVADMFGNPANVILIAQTGVDTLAGTKAFYGTQIINLTNANGLPLTEELILATNNGLFMSSKTNGVQTAMSVADANWTLVSGSANTLFCGIGDMDTILPTTAWPFTLGPLNYPQIYNRSRITQLNGGSSMDMDMDPMPYQFVPSNFNANDLTEPGEPFANFGPISYFWSDGARRFFIVNQDSCQGTANLLQVSPYDVDLYSINRPTLLGGSGLQYIKQFNWVREIGGTGIVMAGTNKGVVALE